MAAITDPFAFNIAKGFHGYYWSLPAANDALIAVLLKSAGLEAFETMADYDDLAALLAGTSDEATFTNYTRKTLQNPTSVVDDTSPNNWRKLSADNWTYATAGGADNTAVGALVICYDNDTTAGTDANLVPLLGYGYAFTPDATDFTVTVSANGLARCT